MCVWGGVYVCLYVYVCVCVDNVMGKLRKKKNQEEHKVEDKRK